MLTYKPQGSTKTEGGEQIDLWVAMREYITLLANPDTQYYTWNPEQKARFAICCRHANATVIRDAKCIIVAANNAGAKVVTQNFGTREDTKFIAVICDEAAMIRESDQWIPITKLTAYDKITVLWLIGDHNQLFPLVVSKGVGLNPFALQLQHSVYNRLILANYKVYELLLSGRMHDLLLRFPKTAKRLSGLVLRIRNTSKVIRKRKQLFARGGLFRHSHK